MVKFALLSASDRFNYGDVLLPVLFNNFISQHKIDAKIDFYSIKKSNLSFRGGIPTESIRSLYLKCNKDNKFIIVVVGGDVLGSKWTTIVSFLYGRYFHALARRLFQRINSNFANIIIKNFFYPKAKFPFAITPELSEKSKVIYLSPGGSGVGKLSINQLKYLCNSLLKSFYISIRDKNTITTLKSRIKKYHLSYTFPKINLLPDLAILTSRLFDMVELRKKISCEIKEKIDGSAEGFCIFQSNRGFAQYNLDIIAHQLQKINEQIKFRLVLLPIGTAAGHDDQILLKRLKRKLKESCIYIKKPNVFDIAYLISLSKLFIGTSLHGNITAMSYGVPRVWFAKIGKVKNFMNSWAKQKDNFACKDFSQLSQKALEAVSAYSGRRQYCYENLITETENKFLKLIRGLE